MTVSDEEIQELWDKLVDSAVRVGVAVYDGEDVIINKALHEHINSMLEKGVMDGRLIIIWEQFEEHDLLSAIERAWMAIIGDFMLCNNKFYTAREGDWHNATQFVTAIIREEMEEEDVTME